MASRFINLDNDILKNRLVEAIRSQIVASLHAFSKPVENGRFFKTVDYQHLVHEVIDASIQHGICNFFEEDK